MPNLSRLFVGGGHAILVPSFPAVTCPMQANMTTGYPPRDHGVVANGFYWRDQSERVSGDQESTVQKLLAANSDNSKVVDEMFLATLSRSPSSEEKQIALNALGQDRQAGAQNLQWALLNLAEFFFNY